MGAPLLCCLHRRHAPWLLAPALLGALFGLACDRSGEPPRAALSVAGALSGDTTGFDRADTPRTFEFPADHGPHPRFRTEWWYFTGNLDGPQGQRVGYQLTFFRNALGPPPALTDGQTQAGDETHPPTGSGTGAAATPGSRWTTRQAWLAHFAVTDTAEGRFFADQRLARGGAIGLAGASATADGLRVWVDDWSARTVASGRSATGPAAESLLPLRLQASQDGAAIDLTLRPGKPIVFHGDGGLSVKGRDPETRTLNASYYDSFTRLPTRGTVTLGKRTIQVSGNSWMDREWSTSALTRDQSGWDWFALQLDDGSDLMVYVLRRAATAGGGIDPASSGTLVARDGTPRHLVRDDVVLDVLDHWRSPRSGAVYPSGWHLRVPSAGLDLTIRPVLDDQELDVGFRYWEGAVDVRGTRDGAAVTGRGYVELTGYDGERGPSRVR